MNDFLFGCLCSLLGCLGFCFVYNLRGRHIFFASLGGAVGWCVFLAFQFTGNDILQFFMATVAIAIYSEILARIMKSPVTVFLIVGILPLVPGGGIYYTMEYCINGDLYMFLKEGAHTIFIAGALAIGILVVSSVTQLILRVSSRKKLGRAG